MPPLFFFLLTIQMALAQSSFYVLEEYCALKFADSAHEILVFDANQYLLVSNQNHNSSYLLCLNKGLENELIADSNYVLSELTDCLHSYKPNHMDPRVFEFTFICFYSSNENGFLYSKRIELLQKACSSLPIRLIFVLQEFPHQMYFENLSSDE